MNRFLCNCVTIYLFLNILLPVSLSPELSVSSQSLNLYAFHRTAADFILHDVVAKLGETSCSTIAAECLTLLAEGCGLEHVLNEALTFAMDVQKNPKVQSELFNWMANAIKEFGFS